MQKKAKSTRAHPPPFNQNRKLLAELNKTGRRLNQTSKEFLRVDAETALTFTSAALTTNDPVKRERNINNAKKAYYTIQQFSQRVTFTDGERAYMSEMMNRLRKDLEQLGAPV
jgi:hypothetical protein